MRDLSVSRHEFGVKSNGAGLILVGGLVGLGFYVWHRFKKATQEAVDAVDPTNPENVVNSGAKKLVAALTGQKPEDVSFSPEVKVKETKPKGSLVKVKKVTNGMATEYTMGQNEKLAVLDRMIRQKQQALASAKTKAESAAAASSLKELKARRAAVAAGAV